MPAGTWPEGTGDGVRIPAAATERHGGRLDGRVLEVRTVATKAIVGEKVGMTQVFDDQNRVVAVTVLKVAPLRVVQVKRPEREGYSALQVLGGSGGASALTKAEKGHFEAAGVEPGHHLVELRIDDSSTYEVGQQLTADLLAAGESTLEHDRRLQGQGIHRRDEAPQLQRTGGGSREPQSTSPLVHRCMCHPCEGLPGHAHGGSDGWPPGHDAEPGGRRRRRRAQGSSW